MTVLLLAADPEVGRGAMQLLDRHGNGQHRVGQLAKSRAKAQELPSG